MTAIGKYLPLFKLKIGFMIAFSSVVAFIATGKGNVTLDKGVILAVVTLMAAASAGALNHYIDRDIDWIMGRTKNRPLATGEISAPRTVLWMAIPLFIAALLISYTALNPVVTLHLFLGGFVYVGVYTLWLKRRTCLNIVFGGFAGSFAILAGGATATPELCLPPVLLALVMFLWTPSHFWSLSIVHMVEYKRAKVPMLPVVVGEKKTALYILLNTIMLVAASLLPVFVGSMGMVYLAGAVISGVYFITRNVQLIRDTSKDMAWKNFKASMIYLSVLFVGIILDVIF
jgi:protoheme IX farnesyltransferase